MTIRQPIVTVVGHVDHGKTSILDSIRATEIAKKEAGGITQKISSTSFPSEYLEKRCGNLLEQLKIKVEIPGFLFIDTPGHAAFTNLRKRGGALADLAILVISISEGLMPQTLESIGILKSNKIPFVVALNKIDAISGWKKASDNLKEDIEKQSDYTKKSFDDKFYKIMNSLSAEGFSSDMFYRITDFTKQVALIPCSGKTGEGIPELLAMLAGISQKFLKGKLMTSDEAKGTVLEIKKERDMFYLESILYDGVLNLNDSIVIAGIEKPVVTKVRALFEALPLAKGFKSVKQVRAASGIRMSVPLAQEVLPGMPFIATKNTKKASDEVQREVSEAIQTDDEGIIAKADSLGSLEALLILLRKSNISVSKVGIGDISKSDVISASSNLKENPLNAVVLGFNVKVSEEVSGEEKIKIMTNDVIYRLIEDFEKWTIEKRLEMQREQLAELTLPCRLKILHYVFRQSKPAIFGVHVESGILKSDIKLMNAEGEEIDRVKVIQSQKKTVQRAKKGEDVAISLPNTTFGRQINEGEILFSDINEHEFRKLKANKKLLSPDEIGILQEIAKIKRREKATWGLG